MVGREDCIWAGHCIGVKGILLTVGIDPRNERIDSITPNEVHLGPSNICATNLPGELRVAVSTGLSSSACSSSLPKCSLRSFEDSCCHRMKLLISSVA